jgi:hypothetical protein
LLKVPIPLQTQELAESNLIAPGRPYIGLE